jgi:hypothetical protein
MDTGILSVMEPTQKITVEVPAPLLERAQLATGRGVTATVREGLQLVAAGHAYEELRGLRGKLRFERTARQLRSDRS